MCVCTIASAVSNSLQRYGLWPTGLLSSWDSSGKNTGVGCHGDLPHPGIEPISPKSPALQAESLPMSHWGSPKEGCNTLKFIL